MHEVGLAYEIASIAESRSGGARVTRVVVDVGELACVLPDSLCFSFQCVIEGTPLEGAALEVRRCPGEGLAVASLEVA
jgi:hydrogenase nickel incorporation protein HypA/HybF